MSTILDALRKIEEERRGQSLDTRTRLLTLSARRSSSSSPLRPLLWIVGASFILAGFVAGMWIARQVPGTVRLADKHEAETRVTSLETGTLGEGAPFHSPLNDLLASDSLPVQRSPFVPVRRSSARLARVEPVSEPQVLSELSDDEWQSVGENLSAEPTVVREVRGLQGVVDEFKERDEKIEQTEQAVVAEPVDDSVLAPAGSTVSFLQWSPEVAKRKAFVKVGDGPLTLVHEGDSVSGYTVVEIQQGRVALRSGTAHFYLRVH